MKSECEDDKKRRRRRRSQRRTWLENKEAPRQTQVHLEMVNPTEVDVCLGERIIFLTKMGRVCNLPSLSSAMAMATH
ncbi:hypothetical protein VNO80_14538 [Phaseolus coccineus]|uniref:Uncharacterized protein n=1 Tax=Phaseolus coccineus TaxID=3886 RepID=A0AAN9MIG8_PHACN